MKTQLTPNEMAELIPSLIKVLETGRDWEAKELHYPAGAIISAVLSIGGVEKELRDDEEDGGKDGFSTNGCQYDWWQKFNFKGKKYTLSGSGFYGGHAFSLSDE